MRHFVLCLLMSCAGLVLAACSSVPTHFYTVLPPAAMASSGQTAPYHVAVLPVTIPAQVDRPQMVVREGSGSVALLDGERWIAPLGDEIRTAVSSELTHQLGAEDVYGLAHARNVPIYRIRINVTRFESVPGQYTLLAAAWSVSASGNNGKVTSCTSRIHESVGSGYASLAEGHQRGLKMLAGDIAGVVRAMGQGNAAGCPRNADAR